MMRSAMVLSFFLLMILSGCEHKQAVTEGTLSPEASVMFLIGKATINGKEVRFHDKIENGASIETDTLSALEIKMGPRSVIRVREKSRLTLNYSASNLNVILQRGKVLNMLERKGDYHIQTPTAVAAVRGTVFFVSVDDSADVQRSYICCCVGSIDVQSTDGKTLETLSSPHHDGRYVVLENGKAVEKRATMKDHSDAEILEMLYHLGKNKE